MVHMGVGPAWEKKEMIKAVGKGASRGRHAGSRRNSVHAVGEEGIGARAGQESRPGQASRATHGKEAGCWAAGQQAGIGTGPSRGGPLLWQLSWASSGLCIILQKGSKLDLNFKPKKKVLSLIKIVKKNK